MRSIGSEHEKLMKAVIERGILPSTKEILKKLRDPLVEKEEKNINIPNKATEMLSPLLNGDIFSSIDEIHSVALVNGLLALKYAIDHPEEFDMEKLIKEIDNSMNEEGWS